MELLTKEKTLTECETCGTIFIEQDLWRQLKRVRMPVFYGDKRSYQSWKAAFLACIDAAPATAEYKLLQLRQYVAGEALNTINGLGQSAQAYQVAKERLERKFGGKRRQVLIHFEELEHFPQIRVGNPNDLEQFADLLDNAVLKLQELGKHHELGDGFLYITLQRKLPQYMLASYHRWFYENRVSESVIALKTWINQESDFQTIANETIHGFICTSADFHISKNEEPRTFFGETLNTRSVQEKILCSLCGANHCIWKCQKYLQKSVPERWKFAKLLRLCYRCLAEGHLGNICPKSRQCGKNGCQKLHHRLLHTTDHFPDVARSSAGDQSQIETNFAANAVPKNSPPGPVTQIGDAITFGTEGKSKNKQTLTAVTYTTYSSKSWKRSQSREKSKSMERSKSRKRSQSWEELKSMERSKTRERSKSMERSKSWEISKSRERPKSKKRSQSRERSKTRGTSMSMERSKTRKRPKSRERSKSKERSKDRENSKSSKRSKSLVRSKSRDRGETKKRWKSNERAKFTKSLKGRGPRLRREPAYSWLFTRKWEEVAQGYTMHKSKLPSKLLSSRSGYCTSAK